MEWPKVAAGKERSWVSEPSPPLSRAESLLVSLFEALDDPGYEIVLDDRVIRILPRESVATFWKKWWDETKERK